MNDCRRKLNAFLASLWLGSLTLLLALACTSTSTSDGNLTDSEASDQAAPTLEIPPIRVAVDGILSRNPDNVMSLVKLSPVGCAAEPGVGAPPTCRPAEQPGKSINAFLVTDCEGVYITSRDELRRIIQKALGADEISVYAIVRAEEGYLVATTYGSTTSPTLAGLIWTVNSDGSIVKLAFNCGNYIARALQYAAPGGTFVVGPLGSCYPGPGENVELVITVEGVWGGGQSGEIAGAAHAAGGQTISERAVITIPDGVHWLEGPVQVFGAIRVGMTFAVSGVRQEDCSVRADIIHALSSAI